MAKPAAVPTKPSAATKIGSAERAFKLKADYEAARNAAISELLEQQKSLDEQLRALGYAVDRARPATPKPRVSTYDANKPCKVCGQTGHDARKHRYQQKAAGPTA